MHLRAEADCRLQGNDDQAFWALAIMSALEYRFPDPSQAPADYLQVVTNAFENIVGRWDTTTCGGGLKWQIYPENAYGYNYKNAISNGCAFALGARLARYTGEQKYADWAVKIYDWTKEIGIISDGFEVFDGTDDKTNCSKVADETQWSYNNAMFLHGSAFMYDYTNGNNLWKDRISGFLNHADLLFFKPFGNATDIMYEWACETGESGRHCNLDQQSFKAYLARFMAKTAMLAPFTKDTIVQRLTASAVGAAKSCSGGTDGTTCGSKWYTGAWDGTSGVGQQLSALEVTQALLMIKKNMLPAKNSASNVPKPSNSPTPKSSQSPTPSQTPSPTPSAAPAPTSTPAASSAAASAPASSPSKIPSSETPSPEVPADKVPEALTSEKQQNAQAPATPPAVSSPSKTPSMPASSATVSSSVVSSAPAASAPAASSPPASTNQAGLPFNQSKPSSANYSCIGNVTKTVTVTKPSPTSSCTPSVTVTVTVPPVPTVPAAATSLISTPSLGLPPVNGTATSPTLPQFTGAGSINAASITSVAAFVAAAVFALA